MDAIVAAQDASPKPHLRHRVHHAYMPDDETIAKMAAYGIPAVIQPGFLYGLGESFIVSLGMERAGGMVPARRYLDAGVPLAGSSDSSVADYNPFVGIWSAIARETAAGTVSIQSEALTREEAIRLYTTGAAYAIREEASAARSRSASSPISSSSTATSSPARPMKSGQSCPPAPS